MTDAEREETRAYIRRCRRMTVDEILKWHEERWHFLAGFQQTLAAPSAPDADPSGRAVA